MPAKYLLPLFTLAVISAGIMLYRVWQAPEVIISADNEPPTAATTPPPSPVPHPELSTRHPPAESAHPHTDDDTRLPDNIEIYLQQQRLPRDQLTAEPHPHGGRITDLRGQYRTVTIAITGEDGKVRLVERRIDPLPAPAEPPAPPAAPAN